MAGLGGGFGRYGIGGDYGFTKINKPQQQIPNQGQDNPRNNEGVDTAPSKPPGRGQVGGLNVGLGSLQKILPTAQDPFRTYGTVEGGRMIPPANPYGTTQNIRYTPGGEWGGGGPINTGPSPNLPNLPNIPWFEPPTGGFTGGQMPPGMSSETSGARTGYYNPQTQIPNMNMGGTGNIGQRGDQRFQNRSMLRNAYAGAGPSLSSRPFRSQMYY